MEKGTKKANESRSEKSKQELETAFSALSIDGGPIEVNEIAEYLDIARNTVYSRVKKHEGYQIIDGMVEKNKSQSVETK